MTSRTTWAKKQAHDCLVNLKKKKKKRWRAGECSWVQHTWGSELIKITRKYRGEIEGTPPPTIHRLVWSYQVQTYGNTDGNRNESYPLPEGVSHQHSALRLNGLTPSWTKGEEILEDKAQRLHWDVTEEKTSQENPKAVTAHRRGFTNSPGLEKSLMKHTCEVLLKCWEL